MAGGFDEKAGGAQMGVMQGPMVSERWWQSAAYESVWMLQSFHLKAQVKDLGWPFWSVSDGNPESLPVLVLVFVFFPALLPVRRGTNTFLTWTREASHGYENCEMGDNPWRIQNLSGREETKKITDPRLIPAICSMTYVFFPPHLWTVLGEK